MKKLIFFIIPLAMLSSCARIVGSGNIVSENRTMSNFTKISVGSAFDVEVKQGPATSIVVDADDNIIKYVETRVEDGVLYIKLEKNEISDAHFKVYVTAPEINTIKASGAATVIITDVLKSADRLTFNASGASKIKGEVDAPQIKADASGAADIVISGKTRDYKADASGSSSIKSKELLAETTAVEASGASSVYVYASVSLTAKASGASSVHYIGAANVINQTTSGASSIKKSE